MLSSFLLLIYIKIYNCESVFGSERNASKRWVLRVSVLHVLLLIRLLWLTKKNETLYSYACACLCKHEFVCGQSD